MRCLPKLRERFKKKFNQEAKVQSAMEYLLTYGWAILIVAIVLSALFSLGFSTCELQPTAPPGSCLVYRSSGPGSSEFINTEGDCNNELPKYVAQFNGASSNIQLNKFPIAANTPQFTISAWVNTRSVTTTQEIFTENLDPPISPGPLCGSVLPGTLCFDLAGRAVQVGLVGGPCGETTGNLLSANSWYFIAVTMNISSNSLIYVDGIPEASGSMCAGSSDAYPAIVGSDSNNVYPFNGMIADLQIYNASLSANEVAALYDEGMGGVPINLNNLVGWWSLNGNANDYSGNLNNGVTTNGIFIDSCASGYSPPS